MAQQSDPHTPQRVLTDEEMELHRQRIPRFLRAGLPEIASCVGSLELPLFLGLIAHVSGYLLKVSATSEPFGLLAELLYAFGFALWTGVVVTLFVQVFPDAKMRQLRRGLAEYEEWKRKRGTHFADPVRKHDRNRQLRDLACSHGQRR